MNNKSIKQVFDFVREMKTKSYSHLGFMPYKEQLQTKEWKYFRLYVLIVKGIKCEFCDYNNINFLQVRHKEFKKGRYIWEYEVDEMMVICKTHYNKINMPKIRERYNKTKSIKTLINGKTKKR